MSIIDKLKEKLDKYPQIKYTAGADSLTIHPDNESGFAITLYDGHEDYTLAFGDWHGHFETEEEVLGFIRFGLSGTCRLREISKGVTVVKRVVEFFEDGAWKMAHMSYVYHLKFWQKKKEVIFSNSFFED